MVARKGRLGIMATESTKSPPFSNSNFYRRLCLIGAQLGLIVFVFSPDRIDWRSRTVIGYSYHMQTGHWRKGQHALPDLVYDRYFAATRAEYMMYRAQVRRLIRYTKVKFLGHGLRGKWQVHDLLIRDPVIAEFLPRTERYAGQSSIARWLDEYGQLFLKPQGGSQGRGALHIKAIDDSRISFIAKGRDAHNQILRCGFYDSFGLNVWLTRAIGTRSYMIQSYLDLTTAEGEPFDVRAFVQKNSHGRWQMIGSGIRKGKAGGLTSNLHGGGIAEDTDRFLTHHYGELGAQLQALIHKLSMRIAKRIEMHHGRLLELGIDYGIEPSGKLWVLEVNSKPGRTIFTRLGDAHAQKASVSNPIHYACYLWERQLGG
jgi:hypothetical protein